MKNYLIVLGMLLSMVIAGCNKTSPSSTNTAPPPILTTTVVSAITATSAISGGTITDNGGSRIIERGVCYDYDSFPTVNANTYAVKCIDSSLNSGTYNANYKITMTNVRASRTCFVRAYAINMAGGIGYGNQQIFTTLDGPLVITNPVTNITHTSVLCGGRIVNDGGSPITERGIYIGYQPSPENYNGALRYSDGRTDTGSFTINGITLNRFTAGSTIYVRAYATNQSGLTGYGKDQVFTIPAPSIPTVTTIASPTFITGNTARCSGSIKDNGGDTISLYGICWGTSPNPTINPNSTGNATGNQSSFLSVLNQLKPNTSYYYRAYATNSIGTGYGAQYTFTTSSSVSYNIGGIGQAGGYIFYDKGSYSNGWRYMEAAPYDFTRTEGQGCLWGVTQTAVGTGQGNTQSFVSACGIGSYAAYDCKHYLLCNYLDWFLPSQDELLAVYQNLKRNNIGGFTGNQYWSSSQNGNFGITVDFSIGTTPSAAYVTTNNYIRPVRVF